MMNKGNPNDIIIDEQRLIFGGILKKEIFTCTIIVLI